MYIYTYITFQICLECSCVLENQVFGSSQQLFHKSPYHILQNIKAGTYIFLIDGIVAELYHQNVLF